MTPNSTPAAPVAPEAAPTQATPVVPESAPTTPAATPAPDAPAADFGSEAAATEALNGLSAADLEALVDSVGTQPNPDPKRKTPKTEAPPPNGSTPSPAATPEAEPIDDVTEGKPLPKNFRFHTEDPQRATYLRLLRQNPEGDPVALAIAAGYKVPGNAATPTAPNPPAAPAPKQAEPPKPIPQLQPLRDEIAKMEQEIKDANESFDYGKASQLTIELGRKERQLDKAEQAHAHEASALAEYNAEVTQALGAVAQIHPQVSVEGTPQFEAVQREIAFLEAHHPNVLNDAGSEYPRVVIERLEKSHPLLFPRSAAVIPGMPAPVASPKVAARPVGQTLPATGGPAPYTAETAAVDITKLTPDQLDELANSAGTQVRKGR